MQDIPNVALSRKIISSFPKITWYGSPLLLICYELLSKSTKFTLYIKKLMKVKYP
jgi:hypothetical protein